MLAFFSKAMKKESDEFALSIVDDVMKSYPVDDAQSKQDKKHRNALGKALDAAYVRAQIFNRERKLGIYGRARLGNGFQWALEGAGLSRIFRTRSDQGRA